MDEEQIELFLRYIAAYTSSKGGVTHFGVPVTLPDGDSGRAVLHIEIEAVLTEEAWEQMQGEEHGIDGGEDEETPEDASPVLQ